MTPLAVGATVLVAIVVGWLFGLALLLFVQSLLALTTRAPTPVAGPFGDGDPSHPRAAILIPAHDEAAGIGATLASIVPQVGEHDRVIVIADNCTDDTAAVARSTGVTVIERTDLVRRGKGYALDFGITHLQAAPPEVVLMFDADCIAGPGCVTTLARQAQRVRRPVQALYLIRATTDTLVARVAEFAQRMRNQVRPSGMRRLGLPCQLMGSGMAFHWSLFARQSVASGHLTEDLQLGLAFARQGFYPLFCPEATVDSRAVDDPEGAAIQRTRWEHGHLGTIVAEWPSLAAASLRRRDVNLATMAWDLAVPPLALFSSLLLIATAVAVVVGLAGGPWWPAAVLAIAIAMLMAAVAMAQRGYARDLIRLREIFLLAPLYLLRKAPVYFRFLVRRQVEWVRTKRDVG